MLNVSHIIVINSILNIMMLNITRIFTHRSEKSGHEKARNIAFDTDKKGKNRLGFTRVTMRT